jgi:hypothetical protein
LPGWPLSSGLSETAVASAGGTLGDPVRRFMIETTLKRTDLKSRAFSRHGIVAISIVSMVCVVLAGVFAIFVIVSEIEGLLASLSRS